MCQCYVYALFEKVIIQTCGCLLTVCRMLLNGSDMATARGRVMVAKPKRGYIIRKVG